MEITDVKDVKDYFILAEVEYCFDNNYDRFDEVIGNEFNSFNESYKAFSQYSIKDLLYEFDSDIIDSIVTPWYITDDYSTELIGFITNCKTASDEDKEKAIALVNTIIEDNHKRNS